MFMQHLHFCGFVFACNVISKLLKLLYHNSQMYRPQGSVNFYLFPYTFYNGSVIPDAAPDKTSERRSGLLRSGTDMSRSQVC